MAKLFAEVALRTAFVIAFTRGALGVAFTTLNTDTSTVAVTRSRDGGVWLFLLLSSSISSLSLPVVWAPSVLGASTSEVDGGIMSS